MTVCESDKAEPDRSESTIEVVDRLRRALRDEHSLLAQYKMIAWGRVFTPIQVTTESHTRCCVPGHGPSVNVWLNGMELICLAKFISELGGG